MAVFWISVTTGTHGILSELGGGNGLTRWGTKDGEVGQTFFGQNFFLNYGKR